MIPPILLDAGPLVAFVRAQDCHHTWAESRIGEALPPMLTCEAVLSEACHLLRALQGGPQAVMGMLRKGAIALPFRLAEHVDVVAALMAKYRDLPMSVADACLVRMSEQYDRGVVLTTDSHFRVYRRHGRHVIPTLMPDSV